MRPNLPETALAIIRVGIVRKFGLVLLRAGLLIALAVAAAWAFLAIGYRLEVADPLRMGLQGIVILAALGAVPRLMGRGWTAGFFSFVAVLAVVLVWWNTLIAPADRQWAPEVSRQVTGVIDGDQLRLSNLRDFVWTTPEEYTENWIDTEYDLSQLQTTDVFLSYWGPQYMAHLIVSFGFANGDQLAWSVEVRRAQGGGFSPIADMFKANTLSILAASERDVVGLRSNARGEDVHLYRLKVTPEAARNILEQYVQDATDLAKTPRWYNSLFTNCTTVVFQIMSAVGSGQPIDWRVIANGYLPEYAYEHGAVNTDVPLEQLRELGRIAPRALAHGLVPGFSAAIRQGVPSPN
ncbi:uncharacterized protein DUF4105 [Pelagimonas varians]|uniref:Lnb N-terminal periplasmic domain-containing protein n=1 Tax=Pelagimonas varians TaxID=696760 RepID=A0A238L158_9RHOB|nr:uncharacterized protein DUF4105 [Pelagimonas varians]SMX48727.1 hypothetical protein PEV8663_03929 [Pelagimonas varians]